MNERSVNFKKRNKLFSHLFRLCTEFVHLGLWGSVNIYGGIIFSRGVCTACRLELRPGRPRGFTFGAFSARQTEASLAIHSLGRRPNSCRKTNIDCPEPDDITRGIRENRESDSRIPHPVYSSFKTVEFSGPHAFPCG